MSASLRIDNRKFYYEAAVDPSATDKPYRNSAEWKNTATGDIFDWDRYAESWTKRVPATAVNLATAIHAAAGKTTPVDADEVPIWNSVGSVLGKVTWANIKATILAAITASNVLFERIGSAVYYSAQTLFNTNSSAGRITGGTLSAAVGPATGIDVSAIEGVIGTSESMTGTKKPFAFAGGNIPLTSFTDKSVNYIYLDYNVGTGVISLAVTVDRLSLSHYTEFALGRVFRSGTDLEFITTGMSITNTDREEHERLMYRGIERMTGAIVAEKSTLYLTTTDGVFYLGRNKIETDAIDTTGADRFHTFHRDGAGGWTETTGQQQVDATQYDDGDGTLGTLTANRYGVHFAFVCNEGDLYLVYGQGDYTLAQAEAALLPASLPPYLVGFAVFAAKIIVKKSATNLYAVESAYANDFSSRAVPDHNDTGNINTGDYQHLTAAELAILEDYPAIPAPTGLFLRDDATWAAAGGGSGHTIEDGAGTDMTARAKLQFLGDAVTDDAGNDRTIAGYTLTTTEYDDMNRAIRQARTLISGHF
jgi:hypothetical protein